MSSPASLSAFTPETLGALDVPGIDARWRAIQARLHPLLAAIAEQVAESAARRLPREWPLYEISYRTLRFTNRGAAEREPVDEYHVAFDRPPRGSGVTIAVSGAERRVFVALQLWKRRKPDLRRAWEDGRALWQPLIASLPEVRFADGRARGDLWLDRYLDSPGGYLLAGYSYSWEEAVNGGPDFVRRLVADALSLLPLNEAVMEQAEALDPYGAAVLRERRTTPYTALSIPPIETIVARIHARGFALPDATIRAYHVALRTRPLVILPGISGTGKTRLTRLYADAIYGDTLAPGQENPAYLLVAVQPDWHNARDLLGYFNGITGRFHATPLLRLLLRASADPTMPYFVCLDEMNLARPEYYLAPILSALETDDRLVDLGLPSPQAETTGGELVASPFRLPPNVSFIGTVNVDESAHPLSDKILDRANLIELTDVDLVGFRAQYGGAVDEAAWRTIQRIFAIVERAGQPFGYRTIAAMLEYIERGRGILATEQALDFQIKQKILPKLRGEDTPRLRAALTELLELLLGTSRSAWGRARQLDAADLAAAPYPASAEKLRRMLERLDADGTTDFYG